MINERELPENLENTALWTKDKLAFYSDRTGLPLDELLKAQETKVAERAALDAKIAEGRRDWDEYLRKRAEQEQRQATARAAWEAAERARQEEKDRLDQEFAGLKRDSARELLEAIPRVPTRNVSNPLPDVDGPWVNARLAQIVAIHNEIADHLKLRREYVLTRGLENIRSDAAVLLAARYLSHHGRTNGTWVDAYKQINAGAFGWTPDVKLKWSENKAR